jgi:hypothetical protein
MPVTPVQDGDTITKAEIQAMHQSVRDLINTVPEANLGRFTFGPQHIGTATALVTLAEAADFAQTQTNVEVTSTTANPETVSGVRTEFEYLSTTEPTYRLDNGGAGYNIRPGKVLVYCTLNLGHFANNQSEFEEHTAWFALVYRTDGAVSDEVDLADTGCVFVDEVGHISMASDGDSSPPYNEEVGYQIAIWTIIDKSAAVSSWSLDFVDIKAARCAGGNVPATKFTVINGTIGFLSLNDRN